MNKMKKLLIIFMALVLLAVAGCGTQPEEVSNTDDKTETRIVKDDLDREVELPAHPERVLALNTSMTETLFDLGIVPVGKVNEYIIPHPEAENLPDVSFELSPNIEIISTLTPDLIIAHARHHGQLLDSLEGSGAAVFFIDPSLDDDPLIGGVALMGKALNREAEASAYLKEVEDKAADLRKKLADSPLETALFIQGGSENIMAARSFCFWGRLLSYLGMENIVADDLMASSKAGFIPFDMETIIQKDPDLILVLQPGFRSNPNQGKNKSGEQKEQGEMNKETKKSAPAKSISPEELLAIYKNDPMWKELTAVKEGRIVIVPGNISPGKINVLDALEITAKLICPEAF